MIKTITLSTLQHIQPFILNDVNNSSQTDEKKNILQNERQLKEIHVDALFTSP